MEFKDPASYTDLAQGKIKHIDFASTLIFPRACWRLKPHIKCRSQFKAHFIWIRTRSI